MKKQVLVVTILLVLCLSACTEQVKRDDHSTSSSTPPDYITVLDAGLWPLNEYTEGLPVPPGTVDWAMLDTEHNLCSINIEDVSESEYNSYMELLGQEGFSVIEEVAEEVDGQDYVSIGTILSDGEKGLSISYIPNNFTIGISFED